MITAQKIAIKARFRVRLWKYVIENLQVILRERKPLKSFQRQQFKRKKIHFERTVIDKN
jgi:hypothetical protein